MSAIAEVKEKSTDSTKWRDRANEFFRGGTDATFVVVGLMTVAFAFAAAGVAAAFPAAFGAAGFAAVFSAIASVANMDAPKKPRPWAYRLGAAVLVTNSVLAGVAAGPELLFKPDSPSGSITQEFNGPACKDAKFSRTAVGLTLSVPKEGCNPGSALSPINN